MTEQVLVLTIEGVPASLDLVTEASGTIGEQRLELNGTATIEFSRWAEPITIEPPVE